MRGASKLPSNKVVTRICQRCYMELSKLLNGFVNDIKCICQVVTCVSVNPIVHGALWSRLATNFFRVSRRGRVCHRVCYRACHMAQHEAAVSNCSFSAQKVLAPRGYQPASVEQQYNNYIWLMSMY